MSQHDWRSFKTFPPRHMASFDWLKCLNFQGDTCQHLIGLLMSLLTHAGMWLAFCMLFIFLFNDTWKISLGFWMVMVETSSSTWRFVIGHMLWTWYYDVSACGRSKIFPPYNINCYHNSVFLEIFLLKKSIRNFKLYSN